jgi:signal transduction histidine kinase
MDAATLAQAADPFFSTKGIGQGTGLGLSMVDGLVSQLGGALVLSSVGPQVAGFDFGTGMAALNFGLQLGSVKDMAGNSELSGDLTMFGRTGGINADADTLAITGVHGGVGGGSEWRLHYRHNKCLER